MSTTTVNGTAANRGVWKYTGSRPVSASTYTQTGSVASGTAAAVALSPADTAKGVVVGRVDWSYAAAPTSGSIQLSDGTVTIGPFTITAGGYGSITFDPPETFTAGATLTVTLADGSQAKNVGVRSYCEGGSAV